MDLGKMSSGGAGVGGAYMPLAGSDAAGSEIHGPALIQALPASEAARRAIIGSCDVSSNVSSHYRTVAA